MPTPRIPHRLTLLTLTLGCLLGSAALAVEIDQPFLQESWNLSPGSILEITAFPSSPDSQYTWSLTKADGSFVQADRGPIFRERFVEAGDYQLRGEVTGPGLTPVAQRSFTIHISAGPSASTGTPEPGALVQTDPPADKDGTILIDKNHQTLLIEAAAGATNLTLDLDSTRDSNGDGDPLNDGDSRSTFFEADGSPLRVWFTSGRMDRTITVRGSSSMGTQTQTLRLSSGEIPPPATPLQPLTTPSGLDLIKIVDYGSGTYAFSVDESVLSLTGRPLLLQWDFGDGRQSMLDRPQHTYAGNGQYTVSLHARDLNTTEEVLSITGVLPVTTVALPVPASSSSTSSVSSQAPLEPSAPGINVRLILTIAGVLLLAVIVGFLLMMIIGKFMQRRLERGPTLPEPPKKGPPPKKPSGPSPLDQPPPMPVVDITPEETPKAPPRAPAKEAPPKATTQPSLPAEASAKVGGRAVLEPSKIETLSFEEEAAPDWLKAGHQEARKRGVTVTAPMPSAETPPTAPSSTEETEPRERPLPPWLTEPVPEEEPPAPAPAGPKETPEPEPAPVPPPQPSAPTPAPEPPKTPPTPPPKPAEQAPERAAPAPVVPPAQEPKAPAISAPEEAQAELTPAERERRRKKRQRYRENKRRREQAVKEVAPAPEEPAPAAEPTTPPLKKPPEQPKPEVKPAEAPKKAEPATDEPIAIIRAENIGKEEKKK